VARALTSRLAGDTVLDAAVSRITPELARRALATPADLYIAHNLGALPAAAAAAARHGARLGFDAEDFHSGQFAHDDKSSERLAIERAERRYLPRCDYVTAASPLIADAYAKVVDAPTPVCVLNVFPLAARPRERRPAPPTGPLRLYWFSQTVGPNRGLEDVVRAMGRCRGDEIELHVRGAWLPGYRAALDRLATEVGLKTDRIVSLPIADSDELIRLTADFDAGLAVESSATVNNDIAQSNKIFSYLLAGLAVIATLTRGQRPLLDELGMAARGYNVGDIDALAALFRAWSRDRQALEVARSSAWMLGGSRFNWDYEKARFLAVVAHVMDAATASAPASRMVATEGASVARSAIARP
jgi:glycosyltransferase involved in cell wall biosynthesis